MYIIIHWHILDIYTYLYPYIYIYILLSVREVINLTELLKSKRNNITSIVGVDAVVSLQQKIIKWPTTPTYAGVLPGQRKEYI